MPRTAAQVPPGFAARMSAMAADPELVHTVERHRAMRTTLQAAYGSVLDETVPAGISALLASAASEPTPVIGLAARRAAKADAEATAPPVRRWVMPEWKALAASVALGLLIGLVVARPPEAPISESGGQLLACRANEGWRIQVLARTEPATGDLRTAAAMPAAVLQAVDASIRWRAAGCGRRGARDRCELEITITRWIREGASTGTFLQLPPRPFRLGTASHIDAQAPATVVSTRGSR